jgi:hypothetical protein
MKPLIKAAIIGLALASAGQAFASSYVTQNITHSVDTITGATFTFDQFDTNSGTLSAIDFLINSSTPDGSATVTNNSASANLTVKLIKSDLTFDPDGTLGFSGYTGSIVNLDTSPTAKTPTWKVINGSGSQVFTINGSQSLIGGSAQTYSIAVSDFSGYLGTGTISFAALSSINLTAAGASYTVDSSLYSALTSTTLRYTYTPASPSPVPEPGQVAASMVLLGGIGGYVFIKCRRKSAVAAA